MSAEAEEVKIPKDFDQQDFMKGAKAVYTRLQNSWDKRDIEDIRYFTSKEVWEEINRQAQEDPKPSKTEILRVNARLLEVASSNSRTVASVLFDVMMRESREEDTAKEVREIWHFSKDDKDPKSFWRQNIFPTLAADQPGYDPSGGYWLGGVWAPTNYAIIRGLSRQGHGDFAREATTRYLDEMHKVFKKTGTVWELYAPDMERHGSGSSGINGEHQARPDFVGWTGCGPIAMVIENLLGFDAQGAKGELTWEITRTDRHGIRSLRFGDVTASLICAKRANPQAEADVSIETNHPFVLKLRRNGLTTSIKVAKGKTRLTL